MMLAFANDVPFGNDVASLMICQVSLVENHLWLWYAFIGGDLMKENKLKDLSMDFSVDIIRLVRQLKAEHETIISNQIGRRNRQKRYIYWCKYSRSTIRPGQKGFYFEIRDCLKRSKRNRILAGVIV